MKRIAVLMPLQSLFLLVGPSVFNVALEASVEAFSPPILVSKSCACLGSHGIERLFLAAESENDDFHDFGEEDLGPAGVVLEDLDWRVEKLRLEEANKKRFLKAKPRFLPYDECAKWVQAFGRWKTKEDWDEWIAMGEKRNAYIPSRPDEYYGRLGQWISWDHFLGVEKDEDDS